MLDNTFHEEIFPNIQSKPPLAQPEAISSCPMACYLGEETNTHLATTSFQVVVESDKVSSYEKTRRGISAAWETSAVSSALQLVKCSGDHRVLCPKTDSGSELVLMTCGRSGTRIQRGVGQLPKADAQEAFQCAFFHFISNKSGYFPEGPALEFGKCGTQEQPLECPSGHGYFHRITESQNHIGWKRPLRSSSPTINLTLPKPPLHHVSKYLIQTSFKYLQGWRLNHFPGQPVPMLDNPLGEEKFPNIQSKPPLAQLEAISSCPITCYLGEETDPHLSTTSFQVVVESDEVSPQPPFLQAKQSQLPQPLLIRLLLQTLHQLRCPSLYALQYLNIPLVVGGPKLNTVFEVRPHQCRVQGHNHFPSPAGHAIFDTGQDAIGLLGRLGTLLAQILQPHLFYYYLFTYLLIYLLLIYLLLYYTYLFTITYYFATILIIYT
ncbi:hypothetical protein QYF61_010699 [Mycteria americana]|uniref:Uncharacterized protein n=1 Tax=Mycteria americana TaxID=33587 RepID=A0AAN7P6C8_MYCAM|nr:hypothetical protein QYF61_010699 [Mycteria americana]